jgi:hypothetical protein
MQVRAPKFVNTQRWRAANSRINSVDHAGGWWVEQYSCSDKHSALSRRRLKNISFVLTVAIFFLSFSHPFYQLAVCGNCGGYEMAGGDRFAAHVRVRVLSSSPVPAARHPSLTPAISNVPTLDRKQLKMEGALESHSALCISPSRLILSNGRIFDPYSCTKLAALVLHAPCLSCAAIHQTHYVAVCSDGTLLCDGYQIKLDFVPDVVQLSSHPLSSHLAGVLWTSPGSNELRRRLRFLSLKDATSPAFLMDIPPVECDAFCWSVAEARQLYTVVRHHDSSEIAVQRWKISAPQEDAIMIDAEVVHSIPSDRAGTAVSAFQFPLIGFRDGSVMDARTGFMTKPVADKYEVSRIAVTADSRVACLAYGDGDLALVLLDDVTQVGCITPCLPVVGFRTAVDAIAFCPNNELLVHYARGPLAYMQCFFDLPPAQISSLQDDVESLCREGEVERAWKAMSAFMLQPVTSSSKPLSEAEIKALRSRIRIWAAHHGVQAMVDVCDQAPLNVNSSGRPSSIMTEGSSS